MKVLFLTKRERQLFQLRPVTGVLIYCGDCAKDDLKQTLLTKGGLCASCGGRSWELAAILAPIYRKERIERFRSKMEAVASVAAFYEIPQETIDESNEHTNPEYRRH